MHICLFIAILSTLLWINVMFAENITAKVNPYSNDTKTDKVRGVVKIALTLVMSLFWTTVVYYFG